MQLVELYTRGHYVITAIDNTEKILTIIANVLDGNFANGICLQQLLEVYVDIKSNRLAHIQTSKTLMEIVLFIDSKLE